jgi:hypothetical protein
MRGIAAVADGRLGTPSLKSGFYLVLKAQPE